MGAAATAPDRATDNGFDDHHRATHHDDDRAAHHHDDGATDHDDVPGTARATGTADDNDDAGWLYLDGAPDPALTDTPGR